MISIKKRWLSDSKRTCFSSMVSLDLLRFRYVYIYFHVYTLTLAPTGDMLISVFTKNHRFLYNKSV